MDFEDKWSWKRFCMLALMMVSTVLMAAGILMIWESSTGEWMVAALSGGVFCVLFVLYLGWNRKVKGIYDEKANNYLNP